VLSLLIVLPVLLILLVLVVGVIVLKFAYLLELLLFKELPRMELNSVPFILVANLRLKLATVVPLLVVLIYLIAVPALQILIVDFVIFQVMLVVLEVLFNLFVNMLRVNILLLVETALILLQVASFLLIKVLVMATPIVDIVQLWVGLKEYVLTLVLVPLFVLLLSSSMELGLEISVLL